MRPVLLVIAGPTASGKTAAAIRAAKAFGCSVVSADSRQLFREMPIGTAAPSTEEQDGVPHYFIASHPVQETYDAGRYETEALGLLEKLFTENPVQILCGGSGLYIDALCNGFDELPSRDENVRSELQQLYGEGGLEALQKRLQQLDPEHYAAMDIRNPHRLMRALEVCLVSGKPYSQQRSGKSKERFFRVIKVALQLDREELYERINRRVDAMMKAGLLDEVKDLLPYRSHNALQTVGYKELFDHLEGRYDLAAAVALIKQHTRNFARRQLTWLRRDKAITWFDTKQTDEMISWLQEQVLKT